MRLLRRGLRVRLRPPRSQRTNILTLLELLSRVQVACLDSTLARLVFERPCGFPATHCTRTAHALHTHTHCTSKAQALHAQRTRNARAMHTRCTRAAHALHMHCTRSRDRACASRLPSRMQNPHPNLWSCPCMRSGLTIALSFACRSWSHVRVHKACRVGERARGVAPRGGGWQLAQTARPQEGVADGAHRTA